MILTDRRTPAVSFYCRLRGQTPLTLQITGSGPTYITINPTYIMRPKRMIVDWRGEGARYAVYHITSRVVDRNMVFEDRERARFLKLAKGLSAFSGFELLSWCLMGNHFHLLVRVPPQEPEQMSQREILSRARHILSTQRMSCLEELLAKCGSDEDACEEILRPFRRRIGCLSLFMKALKQEFTQWYNHVHSRTGTLWEGRFHSVVVEDLGQDHESVDCASDRGLGEVARIVAGYIDLNPMRAGVEQNPGDLGWCSLGAALRGDLVARAGLARLWGRENLEEEMVAGGAGLSNDLEAVAIRVHQSWLQREWARSGRHDLPQDCAGDGGDGAGGEISGREGLDYDIRRRDERISKARVLERRDFAAVGYESASG